MSIGLNIKEFRKRKGVVLRQLSESSGVSVAYLSEIERGLNENVGMQVLRRIAGGLGVSVADLLDEEHTHAWVNCPQCSGRGVVRMDLRLPSISAPSSDEYPTHLELRHLVLNLSELLAMAIRTQGELTEADWERMERMQRKAYAIKHPEMESRDQLEAVVRRRDAAPIMLTALSALLNDPMTVGFLKGSRSHSKPGLYALVVDAIEKASG